MAWDIRKNPNLFYLSQFIIGILLYPYFYIPTYLLLLCILFIFIGLILTLHKSKLRNLFSILALSFWFFMGLLLVKINTLQPNNHYNGLIKNNQAYIISVVIEEQNNSNEKNKKYIGSIKNIFTNDKWTKSSGKILLLIDKKKIKQSFVLGNEYYLIVKINNISPPLNPYQFNYKKFLERKYILKTGSVESVIFENRHSSWWYSIKNINQNFITKVNTSHLSDDAKEFLNAFLLGDRSEMKKENIEAYSKSGIVHLIAISGMHIAFIFGIFFNILLYIAGKRKRKVAIILALISVWLFGIFVGLSPSVSRACLMISIYYLCEILKRPSNILHSIALSALLILLYNPYEIYSIGFQLSYVAVFSIIWLSPCLEKILSYKNRKINLWVIKPICVSIAAQLGTIPWVLYYFHQFSFISIIFNILIIPYTFIITYFSIIELFIIFLPENIGSTFYSLYNFIIDILIKSSYWISSLDFFLIKNIFLHFSELILLTLIIIFLKYFLVYFKIKNIFPILICILLFQTSRLFSHYSNLNKKQFIVFHSNYTLIGFRSANHLSVFYDIKDDLFKIKSFIITPYIIGEKITSVSYKKLDDIIYKWDSVQIQVLKNKGDIIDDATDYIITTPRNIPKSELQKQIIITGFTSNKLRNKNTWISSEKGAFISDL